MAFDLGIGLVHLLYHHQWLLSVLGLHRRRLPHCLCVCSLSRKVLIDSQSQFSFADINIPLFFALYFGYKYVKKTEIWKPEEMDFVTVSGVMATTLQPDLTRVIRVFQRRRKQRGHTTLPKASGKNSLPFCSKL
jgi:amino acid permease